MVNSLEALLQSVPGHFLKMLATMGMIATGIDTFDSFCCGTCLRGLILGNYFDLSASQADHKLLVGFK